MRLNRAKIFLAVVLGVALIAALPLLPREAQAFRGGGGGGFHGGGGFGGGFGGGSFHAGGFHGGGGFGGPGRGAGGVGGPRYTNVNVSHNVNVSGGWGHYGGGGWGAAAAGAAVGAVAGLAIGAAVASLPAAAQPMYVNNQNYYYDGANYYQPCAQGSDMNYCVVSDPNQ